MRRRGGCTWRYPSRRARRGRRSGGTRHVPKVITKGVRPVSEAVLSPLPGRLTVTDPEEGLYDIEIPVRLVITSLVDPEFFPRGQPTVSIEDVDLGVADVRKLQGKEITFKR